MNVDWSRPIRELALDASDLNARAVAQLFSQSPTIRRTAQEPASWTGRGAAQRWAEEFFQPLAALNIERGAGDYRPAGAHVFVTVPVSYRELFRDGRSVQKKAKWVIVEIPQSGSWKISSLTWTDL